MKGIESTVMHSARPRPEIEPCPACGRDTDALRARRVVLLDDGMRYLCGPECQEAFRRGARDHEAQRVPARPTSMPQQVREATRPRFVLQQREDTRVGETAAHRAVFAPVRVPVPWSGIVAAVAGLALAVFAKVALLAFASLACTVAAAVAALHYGRDARRDVGLLAWAAGPAGAILAGIAGTIAFYEVGRTGALAGAAVAAGAMVARSWLDSRARRPVADVVQAAHRGLTGNARVPASGEGPLRYEEIPADEVRTGDEVFVVEGEILTVDGVVLGGEAEVLLHPTAQTPSRRRIGDPVLGGSRVTDGALRVLASRVAGDRALSRVGRFGEVRGPRAARVAQLADRVTAVGGIGALVAAILGLALTGDPGVAGQLSAAAAVLLAAPLLAARRGTESPFVAAASSAGARGIFYSDARSLEDAGRVGVAVLCSTGTVTEGRPEVTTFEPIGDASLDGMLRLVAGAETGAEKHPIALAIDRYVRARGLTAAPVRRITHHAGRGLTALTSSGEVLIVGNRQLLLDEGVSVAVADAEAARAEARGQTALFVGHGGRVRAVISLQDPLRVGARAAVQRLFDQSIEVIILSGDHRATVEAIAKPLDVTNVKAELVPAEQREAVRRLRGSGGLVATVGLGGYNDAPLDVADVPIILGHAGLPEGGRGVAIASDDVRDAAASLWIARAARAEAWRGLLLAVGAGGVLVTGAALGWVGPWLAALVAVGVDAIALPAGGRLLRRIELRLPAR